MTWIIFALIILLITLPGTCELLFLTIGGILPRSLQIQKDSSRLIVVIPAYNEEIHITKTIESLKKCEGKFDLAVVADNCTDNTEKIASALGVRVIKRADLNHRGKNFALEFAFKKLLQENYDVFVVVDADTTVKSNFISTIKQHISPKNPAIQTRYDLYPTNRLAALTFLAFNYLRPRGRQYWGLSSGILGNGFALHKSVLTTIPFGIDSVVEDLSYHLKLVENGFKVQFLENTCVYSECPQSAVGKVTQRQRWEGGRLKELFQSFPNLVRNILKGQLSLIEPLLDLMLLPLTYHTCLLLLLLVIPVFPTQIYACMALGIVCMHFAAAIFLSEEKGKNSLSLFSAPVYMVWKVAILPKIILNAVKGNTWVRTRRDEK